MSNTEVNNAEVNNTGRKNAHGADAGSSGIPRPEHPRPDFERCEWLNLNGQWSFAFDDQDAGEQNKWFSGHDYAMRITVPFCYQSKMSGIGITDRHDIVWYERTFTVPAEFKGKRTILHFGAVDYIAKVWLDGIYLGSHKGGYLPFAFDISNYVTSGDQREHRLTVRAEDTDSLTQPRGKQNWKREPFGCWYTPVTGIWQTVWLEAVGYTYVESIRITPDVDNRCAHVELYLNRKSSDLSVRLDISYEGRAVSSAAVKAVDRLVKLTIHLPNNHWGDMLHLWSPWSPSLYDLDVIVHENDQVSDSVKSYFGMRKIHTEGGRVFLNNRPLFQKLILDQGYWPDSLLTPPSDEAIIKDIKMTREFGYNGARKHQKIEDPRYYYWADRLGLLVWGEMPSPYSFCTEETVNVMDNMKDFIARDYNHPCIITWVPFNESWGIDDIYADTAQQKFASSLYYMIKALDGSRLISTNDGWENVDSDIVSVHDYTSWGCELSRDYESIDSLVKGVPNRSRAAFALGYQYKGQPVLCTEYGGIAFARDSSGGNWGYNAAVETEEDFLKRFADITGAFRDMPYIQGYCYTQLTDVFQEVNGLMDMDRNPKIDPRKIAEINRR